MVAALQNEYIPLGVRHLHLKSQSLGARFPRPLVAALQVGFPAVAFFTQGLEVFNFCLTTGGPGDLVVYF